MPDGRVVDGRNRYLACKQIGVEPQMRILRMDDLAVLPFVIDENVRRRHLTKSQAATCAVLFLPLEKKYALHRKAAAGRKSAPGRPSKDTQKVGEVSSKHSGEAAERAAEKMGTNRTTVQDAAKIEKEDPEAFQVIVAGGKTVSQVKREQVPLGFDGASEFRAAA